MAAADTQAGVRKPGFFNYDIDFNAKSTFNNVMVLLGSFSKYYVFIILTISMPRLKNPTGNQSPAY